MIQSLNQRYGFVRIPARTTLIQSLLLKRRKQRDSHLGVVRDGSVPRVEVRHCELLVHKVVRDVEERLAGACAAARQVKLPVRTGEYPLPLVRNAVAVPVVNTSSGRDGEREKSEENPS